jgi:UDP-N-acetylmuramoyl-tripeptide--D-alanyl-D-alanine ligase
MQIERLYQIYLQYPKVQTDTRKITSGEIFFALKGERFNGNLFAEKALEAGAAFAVVDEAPQMKDDRIILVEDVLHTLQQLALHHRRQFNIPVIAITGSNGKTTTKELIHAVLSSRFRTHTTRGNLNNHIGIPLTLLEMQKGTEMAVIEMGANHQQEIASYCRYVEPTHGIITNCGKAHLEGFGGIEGVRKGKGELYDYLRSHDGITFLMRDYDYLREMSRGIRRIVTYGTSDADLTGKTLQSEPFLNVGIDGAPQKMIRTRLVGDYNLPNVLVAVTVGRHFKVPDDDIIRMIESYQPSNSRSQMVVRNGNHIILDAYNANPTSMRAAIENLGRQAHEKKIVMIGGMMELGVESIGEHEGIIRLLQQYQWERVILVGGDFEKVEHPYTYFGDSEVAAQWIRQHPVSDAWILVKGSRSMQMEKVMESL